MNSVESASARTIQPPLSTGLYSIEDSIAILNDYNFEKTISGQATLWFVLFYSQFCGHCISFSAVWKELAASINAWSPIVRLAAIDCMSEDSRSMCRKHKTNGFPQLVMYQPYSKVPRNGIMMDLPEEVNKLRRMFASLAFNFYLQMRPAQWPNFKYLSRNDTPARIFEKKKASKHIVVVFQEPNTVESLGEQLVLYYGNFSNEVIIRLALPNSHLLNSRRGRATSMAIYNRKNPTQSIYESQGPLDLQLALEIIRVRCLIGPKNTETGNVPKKSTNFVAPKEQLVPQDLRSAVVHLLYYEMSLFPTLSGERLAAAKKFIRMLQKYYPHVDEEIEGALAALSHWLSQRNVGVTSKEWLARMDSLKASHNISSQTKWVTCRGSQIYYRGYSCGLWMLFHTITVQAYLTDGKREDFDPKDVLQTINGYMQQFFSCRQCATHFGEVAVKIPSQVTRPEDIVLWLWRAHNRANDFLKGTPSEDPSHLKVQFPTKDLCRHCYDGDEQWVEPAVLAFLINFYSPQAAREAVPDLPICNADSEKDLGATTAAPPSIEEDPSHMSGTPTVPSKTVPPYSYQKIFDSLFKTLCEIQMNPDVIAPAAIKELCSTPLTFRRPCRV